ncbi:MAG: dephospho-CoA kinase [Deltaproteobacteria bacterium RBG_19FT_COMBO_46_12]|nr:MAG: dephospho-CoA kinase [Deltaproteobacteria bacterium RBG_19FT_COMBO_46_12]
MLIVGLTGGVASGKTAISQVLKGEGAYIIDADQIARELVQPNRPAWNELIRAFGKEILQEDGSIHRKKLADKVFADPKKRKLLNQILHPRIKEEMDRRTKEIGQKDPEAIVVIDAPLIVELGDQRDMDKLIVVASTQTQQIERLKERDGISPEEALRILSSQMPVEEKVKLADYVIRNEGSIEEAKKRGKEVFKELRKVALQSKKRC